MNIFYFQKGFNFSQDGPGNRLVIHLSGCNMRCPWCSNPEGLTVKSSKTQAEETDVLAKEIISCKPMFFEGGGVTFTGGECTLQSEALISLIKILKTNGISVCIETNASTNGYLDTVTLCDYVLTDYKHPNAQILKTVTGADLDLIESNICSALLLKPVHLRIPLIHNFNDSQDALDGFCRFFASLKGEFDIEILPYHEYGKDKWKKENLEYKMNDGFVSEKTVEMFKNEFAKCGFICTQR